MAETDIKSIDLGTPWKPSSQTGKPMEPLPLSPEQTQEDDNPAADTEHERDRSPGTYPGTSADKFSTPEYARSSGAQQQVRRVKQERNASRVSGSASGDELPVITRRQLSHDSNSRGHAGTPPSPPSTQQIPLHSSRSNTNEGSGTTQQTKSLGGGAGVHAPSSIVSAISCSMCSATGVNSLWRRDRAGKPICGKCCEQLRRRLNPRYAAPSRGDLSSKDTHHRTASSTANVFPIRRRQTPPSPRHSHAPYPPRAPATPPSNQRPPYLPSHVNGSSAYGSSSASYNNTLQHPYQGASLSGGQAERYNDRINGGDAQRLASMRYENGRHHQDIAGASSGSGNGNGNGNNSGGGGAGITLPPLSSLDSVADQYRPSSSSNPGGGIGIGAVGGYRSKELVALPAAYPRPSGPPGSGAAAGNRQVQQQPVGNGDGSPSNSRGDGRQRMGMGMGMGPSSDGGERDPRERQVPHGSSAGLRRPPTSVSYDGRSGGPGSSWGIVTEADIQAKRALLVEGRKWIFTMLDETTAMLRQLDDASLHVGAAE